jgi:hypothetical protein
VFFIVVSVLIINAGFLFNRSFTPFGDYEFRSDSFKAMQESLGALARLPVPVPYPFLDGLDWGKMREESGRGFGSMYLLGELRNTGGFRGYYVYAFLLKVPIAVQVLIVMAVVCYIRNRKSYRFSQDELFLICPILFFSLYFNLVFRLQIGIRHLLVIFPLLHVFCASMFKRWEDFGLRRKAVISVLLGYMAVSVLSYFPHYIPYFNEIVWDRKQIYKYLADSNVDWGQGRTYLDRYLKAHPEVYAKDRDTGLWFIRKYREKHMEEYLDTSLPDSGRVIVNVNNYLGVYHPHRYKWLRENFEPIDHVAYVYLLFDVTPRDSVHP